jgi:dihydrofolate reductase / thymidylate synthase
MIYQLFNLLTMIFPPQFQPWKLPCDMEHFKKVTVGANHLDQMNAVVMGRKTWESIPPKFRPLPHRMNVVLSRQLNYTLPDGVIAASSLQDASIQLEKCGCVGDVFVIGGSEIYQQAIVDGFVKSIIYTAIDDIPNAKYDAFFPDLCKEDWDVQPYEGNDSNKENGMEVDQVDPKSGIRYRFLKYTKKTKPKNVEEQQYLDLCREVLETGVRRGDRTGTGTLSKFGTQMRFSLRGDTLPLLTTKRTFWRGVAEELLWFVKVRTERYLFHRK